MNQPILAAARFLATAVCLIPSCPAADSYDQALDRFRQMSPAQFIAQLEATRPPRLSPGLRARIIAALPSEGELKKLSGAEREKLASVAPVLRAHGRDSDYLVKVVDAPEARVAVHARLVILITQAALKVLSAEQLQASVAHEIGHEYTWDEYQAATKRDDRKRLREIELFCDGIAMVTLARIGANPARMTDALRIMEFSNQTQGILRGPFATTHPSVSERARFGKEIAAWLVGDVSLLSRP
jgi:Zn-dependent protease with chaperone function